MSEKGADVMQEAVRDLCRIAPKLTDDLNFEQTTAAQKCIEALVLPLSTDDVSGLISLLPADGDTAYGLNWSILHAVEAAPEWPLWDMIRDEGNDWVRRFCQRLANAGFEAPCYVGSKPS
ncbi:MULTISPECIES: hypothetical protein [Mesorhizobium]|uniref:Uncharacterized protein n=2 Tax=Mesorhizobium TaxID=68287 RepID=A0A1A5J0P6_RHILI|nr:MULTISPECIES: hypothetical protein [Mesorhizobium]MBE1710884.1 hypothetical protein [Mesorhizobium japonicum]MBE1715448.1 hypothetical protein [Mesorhizobium japonicum]MUT23333.1 hypothetical protein [Mesorhizobium japonicum]MUT29900.1 hypothetical protein [Mesorhizobium japonicum]OBP68640.1 hypothetical protein BAE42_24325 [Mesorhizobium loti]